MKNFISFVLFIPFVLFGNSEFLYDASSNLSRKQLQNGDFVAWEYDLCNRPIKISSFIDSSGSEYRNEYDEKGHLIKTTSPEGNQKRFWYCSNGRLGAVLDALGHGTVYQYDSQGHVIKIAEGASLLVDDSDKWEFTCPMRFISEFTYDPGTGLLLSVAKAGHLIRQFSYDSRGQLETAIDPSGYIISRTYDDRGRLIAISDSQNELVRYSYDDQDRPLVASYPSGKVGYSYDKNGRVSTA